MFPPAWPVWQKFWVPFLDTVCTAGTEQGGFQPAELLGRLCPGKLPLIGQVAPLHSIAEVPSVHSRQAPDAQLS